MTDALRPASAPVRSYRTTFERDEDPISEGGIWLNGETDGIDWCNVVTRNGVAYGQVTRMAVPERRYDVDVPEGDYDDPTAVIGGAWGRNQFVNARVFSKNPTDRYYQEVEIRLRSSITPRSCTGYEVFWRCLQTDGGYAEIVRWNGRIADFTSLVKHWGPQFGVKDGDLVEASIVGNVITGYVNGVEVITANDDTWESGCPGIGFNFGVGDTNVDHGFTSYEVDTYDD